MRFWASKQKTPKLLNTPSHFTGIFLGVFPKFKGITSEQVDSMLLNTHTHKHTHNVYMCVFVVCIRTSLHLKCRIPQDYFKLPLLNRSSYFRENFFSLIKLSHPGLHHPFPFPTKHLKPEKKSQTTFFRQCLNISKKYSMAKLTIESCPSLINYI